MQKAWSKGPVKVSSKKKTVRQDIVDSAVRFLVDPKVQTASLAKQISFLETKGLSSVEIDEALKRSKVITPSANDSSAIGSDGSIVNVNAGNDGTLSQQDNGGALVGVGGSGGQQQQQQARYHNQYGSTMPVGIKPIAPPRPQYSWKDYFIAAVMAGGLGRRVKQEEREELIRENNRLTGQLIERIEKLEHKIEDVQSNTKGQMDEIKQELIGQVANKATEGEKDREMYEKERQEFERMLEKSIPDLIEGTDVEQAGSTIIYATVTIAITVTDGNADADTIASTAANDNTSGIKWNSSRARAGTKQWKGEGKSRGREQTRRDQARRDQAGREQTRREQTRRK
ncbi:Peroxisomal membrane protein PER10 [Zancudomyces culisetae]|uniref:Peroxisomal membrane protein PEX14 n=1 Tax=Zancudomyces culisetae TaxID=1213189 RepID=A0A1R1PPU2_ZANCU|nr:Peroxisomal membrane protein PER10 [Zancudomyces culisetae]|eukprot:OMH83006.1 Peroxisomal membrane protein PER10 [Zancudomyces culisetae]